MSSDGARLVAESAVFSRSECRTSVRPRARSSRTYREQQADAALVRLPQPIEIAAAFHYQQVQRAKLPAALVAWSEANDAAMAQRMITTKERIA